MLGIYIRTSREDNQAGAKESPIEQQKQAGIQFALEHSFSYEVYEDKGISGFKIADDDNDPFKNRPRFTDMINDIKARKITKVWVWEHSRLSRNQYASAIIFNLFEKQGIQLFEKEKEFHLNDPQNKLFRSILDSMAEYERSLIVGRTTRGLHNKINQGKRSFGSLYGYTKTGADKNGYKVWETVPSEIENIKHAYKRILEGSTLKQLIMELYNNDSIGGNETLKLSSRWHIILSHFSYTGYELNMAGLELFKKFNNFEIDNLAMLNNEQYYVRSQNYPHKLVSIENWIQAVEKLRVKNEKRRRKFNRASKNIATGLITCGCCGLKYYSRRHRSNKKQRIYEYVSYEHYSPMIKTTKCTQQQSYSIMNIDNIFKLFFFYHYIFFDNTGEMLQEAQRLAKVKIMKLKEEVSKLGKNEKQFKKQLENYESILGETTDKDDILTFGRLKIQTEDKQKANYDSLAKAKIELDQLNEQYSENEAVNLHANAKEKVLNFFKKMNTEEQRNNLIEVIKNCFIFGKNLLIDTGNTIFVFDTAYKHFFNEKLLDDLAQDAIYTEHFFGLLNDNENKIEKGVRTESIRESIFNPSGFYLEDYDLSNATYKGYVLDSFKTTGIQYDIENHKSVVFVEPLHLE